MSAVSRRTGGAGGVVALMIVALAAAGVMSIWSLAQWISTGQVAFVNPVEAIVRREPWTSAHTTAAVLVGVVVLVAIAAAIVTAVRAGRGRVAADRAAPYMGRGRDIAQLLPAQLAKKHARMGLDPRRFLGLQLGRTVLGNLPVRASYEDTLTVIAPPRREKTVSIVVPNILLAPGTMLVTSVKPDILSTLAHRLTMGVVHLFDPQGLAAGHAEHRCWWNPLATVRTLEDAALLAEVFAAASYDAGERSDDAFFAKHGKALIANYLLAAAVSGKYLPVVLDWLNRWDDPTPVRILADDHPRVAELIQSSQSMTERTRSGVYGWAQGAMGFLAADALRTWVTPTAGGREFIPDVFSAAPANTLYLLSEEGPGSAGPLIAALTRAVLTAAENDAKREPSGRRRVPLVAILDEAGNICRIPDLPSKYTHYGSRGIIPVTILQSQEQGEQVWGAGRFAQLWGASTVQIFGGGNASNSFLRDLSEQIGDYHFTETSTSVHDGRRTVNKSRHSDRIMATADLRSLGLGRMIVFASGCPAVLVRTVPWFTDKQLTRLVQLSPPSTPVRHVVAEEVLDAP